MYRSMMGVDSVYRTSSKRLNLMVPGNLVLGLVGGRSMACNEVLGERSNRLESILVIEGMFCIVLITSKEN
ncbi:hypothetical protein EYC84_004627 [Monilinia fructicola]|uniref:Uncharacterized protein n=1 Tax=Monilinia fructicola TaxID=38448 RepID=A0A5M9K114_MONFR|nr:hypothetical protein EYC84_004627 [Monilinia fructicola]